MFLDHFLHQDPGCNDPVLKELASHPCGTGRVADGISGYFMLKRRHHAKITIINVISRLSSYHGKGETHRQSFITQAAMEMHGTSITSNVLGLVLIFYLTLKIMMICCPD